MSNRLIIEPLPPLEQLVSAAAESDLENSVSYAPSRRREFLAWRAVVRRELGAGVVIGYDPDGAPTVDCGLHIGVSHSRELVAVVVGESPCAVDTESVTRRFDLVAERYMSLSESRLSTDPRLHAAVWCAKETMYKLARRPGLNLRDELHVTSVDFAAGAISGRICGGPEVAMSLMFRDGHAVVWGALPASGM